MGLSYNRCIALPTVDLNDFEFGTREVCIDLNVVRDGTRQCASGSTPPMQSFDFTLLKRDIDDNVTFDLSIWMGIELLGNGRACLWMGQEEYGVCVNSCGFPVAANPALADVRSLADSFVEELDQAMPDPPKMIVSGAKALLTLLALALFFIWTIVTGGSTVA